MSLITKIFHINNSQPQPPNLNHKMPPPQQQSNSDHKTPPPAIYVPQKSIKDDTSVRERLTIAIKSPIGALLPEWNGACESVEEFIRVVKIKGVNLSEAAEVGVKKLTMAMQDLQQAGKKAPLDNDFRGRIDAILVTLRGSGNDLARMFEVVDLFRDLKEKTNIGKMLTKMRDDAIKVFPAGLKGPQGRQKSHLLDILKGEISKMESTLNGKNDDSLKIKQMKEQLSILEKACKEEKDMDVYLLSMVVQATGEALCTNNKPRVIIDGIRSTMLPQLKAFCDGYEENIPSLPQKREHEYDNEGNDDVWGNNPIFGTNNDGKRIRQNEPIGYEGIFPKGLLPSFQILKNAYANAQISLEVNGVHVGSIAKAIEASIRVIANGTVKKSKSYEEYDLPWEAAFNAVGCQMDEAKKGNSSVSMFRDGPVENLKNLISMIEAILICNGEWSSRFANKKPIAPIAVEDLFAVINGMTMSHESAKRLIPMPRRVAMLRSMFERVMAFVRKQTSDDKSIYGVAVELIKTKILQINDIFSSKDSDDEKFKKLEGKMKELGRYEAAYNAARNHAAMNELGNISVAAKEAWDKLRPDLEFLMRKGMELTFMHEIARDAGLPVSFKEKLCRQILGMLENQSRSLWSVDHGRIAAKMTNLKGQFFLDVIIEITNKFVDGYKNFATYGISATYADLMLSPIRRNAWMQMLDDYARFFMPTRRLYDVPGDGNCWFYSLDANDGISPNISHVNETKGKILNFIKTKYVNRNDLAALSNESIISKGPNCDELDSTSETGRYVIDEGVYEEFVAGLQPKKYVDSRHAYIFADFYKRPIVAMQLIFGRLIMHIGLPGYKARILPSLSCEQIETLTIRDIVGLPSDFVNFFNKNRYKWDGKTPDSKYGSIETNMRMVDFLNMLSANRQTLCVGMPAMADSRDYDNSWGNAPLINNEKKTNNHFVGIVSSATYEKFEEEKAKRNKK